MRETITCLVLVVGVAAVASKCESPNDPARIEREAREYVQRIHPDWQDVRIKCDGCRCVISARGVAAEDLDCIADCMPHRSSR